MDRAEGNLLLDRMNAHYAELRGDDRLWSAFRSEEQTWDATLLDGVSSNTLSGGTGPRL